MHKLRLMLKSWCVRFMLNKIIKDAYVKMNKVVKGKKNIQALRIGVLTLIKRF
jgi:hypothetical protein